MFIDDYTRKVFVYFLESKTNVKGIFEHIKSMVERQSGNSIQSVQFRSSKVIPDQPGNVIKIVRSDNGKEYVNIDLENYFTKSGIRFQTTNPQQNGLAERSNRTIVEKWVFKTKLDSEGCIVRYKARLVIKGYAQRRFYDFDETYSPVLCYTSLRYLLAMAVEHDLDIDQMDAISAFLQGDVEETIFMVQPKEFAHGNKVCRLKKAIYGLKQASRQ